MTSFHVKYSDLCDLLWKCKETDKNSKHDYVISQLKSKYSLSEDEEKSLRTQLITTFFPNFNTKWNEVCRKKDRFIHKNTAFLQKDFIFDLSQPSTSQLQTSNEKELDNIDNNDQSNESNKVKRGRPRLSYEEGSSKTKKIRSAELSKNYSREELMEALKVSEKDLIRQPNSESSSSINIFQYVNVNKSLAMYVDLDLSKAKYEKLRLHNKDIHGNQIYPHYKLLTKAKNDCFPDHIHTTSCGSKVNIISILDHTLQRILSTLNPEILEKLSEKKLVFLVKWGMDGASDQQTTRQKWFNQNQNVSDQSSDSSDSDNEEICLDHSDASVLMTTLVPLQITANDTVLWTNVKPSSVSYCRPINFKFIKETPEAVKKNYNYYMNILDKVKLYNFTFKGMTFEVKFDLWCSMLDGKENNILTEHSATKCCNICKVGPKYINNIEYLQTLSCNTNCYKFGFPILHSWIRFMEYVLHVSYNLDFKKGSAMGPNKELKKERKQRNQKLLRLRLNLTVDVVKQGAGTTNTGNVSREFFSKAAEVSKIIEIDEILLVRLHTVLQVISQRKEINVDKFKAYCLQTAKLCVHLYPWYPMPPSVHKVLIHGFKIIQSYPAPIGWFSEEPQEASNKLFRKARSQHSRMFHRTNTNIDIMHHMLIISDPQIIPLRYTKDREKKELTSEAKELLK